MNHLTELKYGNTKCYCVNNRIVIDTDWAGTLPAFYQCAKSNHIDIKQLQYLFLTHFHPDHMGIAQELAELGMTIVVFDVQQEYVHSSDHIFTKDKRTPFKPICDKATLHIACDDSRQFLKKLGIYGEFIHTAGHSDDSVSLILDEGTAIVGDLYPLHTVPSFHNPQLEESWNKILSHGINRVHYAHFPDEVLDNIHSLRDVL